MLYKEHYLLEGVQETNKRGTVCNNLYGGKVRSHCRPNSEKVQEGELGLGASSSFVV